MQTRSIALRLVLPLVLIQFVVVAGVHGVDSFYGPAHHPERAFGSALVAVVGAIAVACVALFTISIGRRRPEPNVSNAPADDSRDP